MLAKFKSEKKHRSTSYMSLNFLGVSELFAILHTFNHLGVVFFFSRKSQRFSHVTYTYQ